MRCRRFRCWGCKAVVLVGPAEMVARSRFLGRTVVLALFLWTCLDEAQGIVWARCLEHPADRRDLPERWRSLARWGRKALTGALFPGLSPAPAPASPPAVRRAAVRGLIERLMGHADRATREATDEIRVLAGALQVM